MDVTMLSKRSEEGVILIDHRNSPGISPEFMRDHNLDGPAVGAGVVYESATCTCKHCGTDVILNPKRTRDREYCSQCDGYICDSCGLLRKLGVEHRPIRQVIADLYHRLTR